MRSPSLQLQGLGRFAARTTIGPRAATSEAITIYPVERLGCQLFQYATGLAQARRLGCPLNVAFGFYRGRGAQRPWSDYALGAFDNGLLVSQDPAAHRPILRGLPVMLAPATWERFIGRHLPRTVAGIFTEAGFGYDPRIERVEVGTTLLGFFQSWKYFTSVAEEVRERMLRLAEPSAWYQDVSTTIVPGDGSIILNVRRGDYLLPHFRAHHGIAERAFYERALDLIRRTGVDGTVYLVSDANDDVARELAGIADLVPLTPPPGTPAHHIVALLARADALAIANSTFSWWGAWLGDRPGRPVVAPRPWFEARIDTRDLLLPTWTTLDRA